MSLQYFINFIVFIKINNVNVVLVPLFGNVRNFFGGMHYSDPPILQGRHLGKDFLFKNPRYLPCNF